MEFHEKWIRERLPRRLSDLDLSQYFEEYDLCGLTVTAKRELGGDIVVYEAENENDLRLWEFDKVCRDIGLLYERGEKPKKWRYTKLRSENGKWLYAEHTSYDYNAIEDTRIYNFEAYLRIAKPVLPPELWKDRVREHVSLLNRRFAAPHWDYDENALCFIEISDSRELSPDGEEEPGPGSVIKTTK